MHKNSYAIIFNMLINTDPKKIDEVLSRGVEEVIVKENLRKEMLSGRELKIYLGTDVTGKDLHLGHATIHKKLRDFQELGHKVTLVIGDFTTLVGDHSDKLDQRIETNKEEITENLKTYTDQFGKTVDLSRVEIVHNSAWLSKLNFNDVIELARIFTVQQNIEREAFKKRITEGKPIGLDEFLYPLMQGYDAYALKTDIQIGGTDQTFNLMAGRKVMEHFGVKPQNIITIPLLVGNDGRKMGKSLKNYIAINSSAFDKYAGVMGIVDEIIISYFVSLTRITMGEIEEMEKALKSGSINPRDLKMKLAYEITKDFHGEKEAHEAEEKFKKVVQGGGIPEDIKEVEIGDVKGPSKTIKLTTAEALIKWGLCTSKSEAKRLIEQGGVDIDEQNFKDPKAIIEFKPGMIIKAGKKKFVKIV